MIFENRRFQVEEIARLFNVPLFYLGQQEKTTFASAYESGVMFYFTCLMPHIHSLQSAFTICFLDESEEHVLDTSPLTRASVKERYEAHKIAIDSGIYSSEHAALMEGIDPAADSGTKKKLTVVKDDKEEVDDAS